jgi:hypothetical protein
MERFERCNNFILSLWARFSQIPRILVIFTSLFAIPVFNLALFKRSKLFLSNVNTKGNINAVIKLQQSKTSSSLSSRKLSCGCFCRALSLIAKFRRDSPIPPASPLGASPPTSIIASPVAQMSKSPKTQTRKVKKPAPVEPVVPPKAAAAPEAVEILCSEDAELHLFDVESGTFVMQDQDVTATVSEIGNWKCEYIGYPFSQFISNRLQIQTGYKLRAVTKPGLDNL